MILKIFSLANAKRGLEIYLIVFEKRFLDNLLDSGFKKALARMIN
jgi:hypothetical protein